MLVLDQEDDAGEADFGVVLDVGAVLHQLHQAMKISGFPFPDEDLVIVALKFLAPPVHGTTSTLSLSSR